jgi:DNA-binding MurR/RpiR family transcriptional regulator
LLLPDKALNIGQVVDMHIPDLTKTELAVADYIRANQDKIIYESITEIAEKTESSEASVIRMCRKLGYKGFQDLKISIARNFVTPLEEIHEGISSDDTAASIIAKSFRGTIDALHDTEKILDPEEFDRAADAILAARHVYVFGLGSSAPVAVDIAHKFLRCGICSYAYSDNHFQIIVSCSLEAGDAVIGVSHSGNSRDIVEALTFAKKHGAATICLTNFAKSPITKEDVSDIRLYTSSSETKYRVHGLASRIAQLAIVDALFVYVSMKKGDAAIRNIERVDQGLTIRKY